MRKFKAGKKSPPLPPISTKNNVYLDVRAKVAAVHPTTSHLPGVFEVEVEPGPGRIE
jgi:hypothetical protein